MPPSSMKILCRYQYDPLDRLTGLKPLESPGTQRFYQNNELVNEIDSEAQLTIVRHGEQPLAQRLSVMGVSETALLATDPQRSPLVALTDADLQRMAYTAYGHRSGESGLSCLLGFNGERSDSVTGHYLLGQGNRAFNPVLMRFNSPDELSPFGEGGINAYAYCGGDPVNRYDPSGNSPLGIIRPWRAPPPPNTPTLMVAFKNRIKASASPSINITSTSRTSRPALPKIEPQRYAANNPTNSSLPAEPALTLLTQTNSPNTSVDVINQINKRMHEAQLYDRAIKKYPIMETWTVTPRRKAHDAAKIRYEKLVTNKASAEQIDQASAELTLARWNAKSGDVIQLVETLTWDIRR
ncbi:RHS repeat-associated core domain-containing protein [Pseudomonas sp. SMV71]|uniref:RHS repeat-associated core domain-containing protein n=1 Tax=Pseudomonas sp. SMV71 TaxID=3390195 RepID=UPI003F84CF64